MTRTDRIESLLRARFLPHQLEVRDDSQLHAGHPGARSGKGHFHVRIVADAFTDRPLVECHRMVYAALGDMMSADIHALSLETLAPEGS